MIVKLPDGFYLVRITPMHRRKPRSMRAYSRPTDWLAQAGSMTGWGRTRRAALANLKAAVAVEQHQ